MICKKCGYDITHVYNNNATCPCCAFNELADENKKFELINKKIDKIIELLETLVSRN